VVVQGEENGTVRQLQEAWRANRRSQRLFNRRSRRPQRGGAGCSELGHQFSSLCAWGLFRRETNSQIDPLLNDSSFEPFEAFCKTILW